MYGFKSFADKMEIEFNPGITAIVGPNGCGKSNISDAFLWVLGEQSAKNLRGAKMHDVIFAGTQSRKPMNYAEVTLTLSDVKDVLPVDFEELAVTRRLYRSGESEYLINRIPVRLRDIQEMMLGSGIGGKNPYAFFEQGKINRVIQCSPLERRSIFEEAAGISSFLKKKKEALRKLEHADGNLVRAHDIHKEVTEQKEKLERQAKQAKQFRKKEAQKEALEKAILASKWHGLNERWEKGCVDEEGMQSSIGCERGLLEVLLAFLLHHKDVLAAKEQDWKEANEKVFQSQSHKKITLNEHKTLQERKADTEKRIRQSAEELEELRDNRTVGKSEYVESSDKLKLLDKDVLEQEKVVATLKHQVLSLESNVTEKQRIVQEIQAERFKSIQQEHEITNKLREVHVRNESILEKISLARSQLREVAERLANNSEILQGKQSRVTKLSKAIDEDRVSLKSVVEKLQALESEYEKLQPDLDLVVKEELEATTRQEVLLQLRKDQEAAAGDTQKIITASEQEGHVLFKKVKPLYQVLTAKPGTESKLAIVLKAYSNTLLVESSADLEALLLFASDNGLEQFSVLCLEHLNQFNPNVPVLESLVELTEHPELLTHFFSNVREEESLSDARKCWLEHRGSTVLTDSGSLVDSKGVIFLTSVSENNVFLQEAELRTIRQRLDTLSPAKQKLQEDLKKSAELRSQLTYERAQLEEGLRQQEMRLLEANLTLQQTKTECEQTQEKQDTLQDTLEQSLEEELKFKQSVIELSEQQKILQKTRLEKDEGSERLEKELAKDSKQLMADRANLLAEEAKFEQVSKEKNTLLKTVEVFEAKDQERTIRERKLAENLSELESIREEIQSKLGQFEERLLGADKASGNADKELEAKELALSKQKEKVEEVESAVESARTTLNKKETQLHEHSIKTAKLKSSKDSLEADLLDRFQKNAETLIQEGALLKGPIADAEKLLKSLRQEVNEMGNINLASIEEYEECKARYEFLGSQLGDLEKSREELLKIIAHFDEESRGRFTETFEQVRENFQKIFQILFRGGEADLVFIGSEDVLEAGIEISAKPPGKRMRSIHLLSGGEKCLTAMALLFAIFEVKPAPFCILDEIDAPLDDTNVERFLSVVKHFIDRCQFVIITHNKRTMALADVLFGVSMQEKGVSTLLSMDFMREERKENLVSVCT